MKASAERQWLQAMHSPLPRRRTGPLALLLIATIKGFCLPPYVRADAAAARRPLVRQVTQEVRQLAGADVTR